MSRDVESFSQKADDSRSHRPDSLRESLNFVDIFISHSSQKSEKNKMLSAIQPSELSFPSIFKTDSGTPAQPGIEPSQTKETALVPVKPDGESRLNVEQTHHIESPKNEAPAASRIVESALKDLGKKEWAKGGFDYAELQYGNWGCAASVSNVLTESGIPVHQASVEGLKQDLLHRGWHRVPYSERQPGDVVIMNGGLHTGIVADRDHAYENSSSLRKFVKSTYGMNEDAEILRPGK